MSPPRPRSPAVGGSRRRSVARLARPGRGRHGAPGRIDHDEELRIDDRVHGHAIDTARTSDEGVVRYSVSDGERSGVYLARLLPRSAPDLAPGAEESIIQGSHSFMHACA